jgi:phosphatidylethanolamine/phosphatidyl-N-methylethanolamine N-methyltransferase
MKRFIGEHIEFFRQYRRRFQTTGAVAPSSRFLARAMVKPFEEHTRPCRVLEIGPGTGAVTRRIVRQLKPDDRLDLVELNEEFAGLLRQRFADDPAFRTVAGRAEIHQCPIQEFSANEPYQFIISGLPLNNFPAEMVREIFAAYFKFLAPGGVLSYFEYMYMRPLRRVVSDRAGRGRLSDLEAVLQEHLSRHRFRRDWVFVNFPPAWVQHLRRDHVAPGPA